MEIDNAIVNLSSAKLETLMHMNAVAEISVDLVLNVVIAIYIFKLVFANRFR